jgi:hypothetical protein
MPMRTPEDPVTLWLDPPERSADVGEAHPGGVDGGGRRPGFHRIVLLVTVAVMAALAAAGSLPDRAGPRTRPPDPPVTPPGGPDTPSSPQRAVYPLEHSGAQVAMAPDGAWTLVASPGPTPEVTCLQLWAGLRAVFACPLRISDERELAFRAGPLAIAERPTTLAVLGIASPLVDRLRAAIYHEPDVEIAILPRVTGSPHDVRYFVALLPSNSSGDIVAIDGGDHIVDRLHFEAD